MTDKPKLTPIESSMFSHHAYDPSTRKMTVQYKDGGAIYKAHDVPIEKHQAFTENQSPGRYFNERLKANHVWRKLGR